ncbi:ribosome biogenesis protein BMS1 homolog [Condylostylus longicornis]|uniref:ribosome biogenesis protein BMS1 homolog n=1 Tax=Condylostylus longicornis TaxID=2530218 RepID=UPI00244E0C0A|nr:ribosome biogenesis protein BMS1 homolog [Condylostylus longicornis]
MDEDNSSEKKKAHRKRNSGVKAEKKKLKSKVVDENLTARQRNPKAFAINSAKRAELKFRRKEDLTAKKQHIPIVDKTPDEPPPVLVAVVGPPKVGKTTLVKNLIRNFTKTNVTDIKGPITIVTSKKRRITLVECNNDINSMIDIAKCADLVLLLCDASFGFEMEIFEFLNICQVHGMPKIMGVLTHLDVIKNAKTLRRRKKELKHRFWTEVYDGAKLFYLSGMMHGEYLRNEINNLGRFISIIKMRPLTWRGDHGYVLADRVEDITNTEIVRVNPKSDRDIVLYGYVRGAPFKAENHVHIAGLGDIRMTELSKLADPCPIPGTEKKRTLLEKERLLYAPMSGVGGIIYDKDALYIELQGSHSHKQKNAENSEQNVLMQKIQEKKVPLDIQVEEQKFRLFSDGEVIASKNFSHTNYKTEIENIEDESDQQSQSGSCPIKDQSFQNDNLRSGSEEEDKLKEEESSSSSEEYQSELDDNEYVDSRENIEIPNYYGDVKWKENITSAVRENYLKRQSESQNLMKLVYGIFQKSPKNNDENDKKIKDNLDDSSVDEEELGGLFKISELNQKNYRQAKDMRNKEENSFFEKISESTRNWLSDDNKTIVKNCFVTGKWKSSEDAEELLRLDEMSDAESECYGDFEDLETGKKFSGLDKDMELKNPVPNLESGSNTEAQKQKMSRIEENNLTKAEIMAKKLKLKAKFDAEYDNKGLKDEGRITGDHQYYDSLKIQAQAQSELNKKEFAELNDDVRCQIEGYRPGMYVRMKFANVSSEFIENFDSSYPILIGALNMSEENIGYVNCKIKKHRWYKKTLKTADPLIISLGWRRFQTIPIYAKVEDNFKHRYLKYTPNHVTCSMTFWGPITPQNTGFLALQSVQYKSEEIKKLGFRIAATGCVTETDKATQIQKKLKLIGEPFKIYKKTAFIKGMFTTRLEVAKFEGAKIKTVSGIRGQIKKSHHDPEGSFRATFEDKILLSDIVFCRTWFKVEVPKFYTPVTSLLLPQDQKNQWEGLKTLGQIKREKNIRYEANEDSLYTNIERAEKIFKPLKIPKSLQIALPYEDKPKTGLLMKNKKEERVAVIRSPYEQKVSKLMKMLETNYAEKNRKLQQQTEQRLAEFKKRKTIEEKSKLKRQKDLRKKISRALSKMNKKKQ